MNVENILETLMVTFWTGRRRRAIHFEWAKFGEAVDNSGKLDTNKNICFSLLVYDFFFKQTEI